jgi:hypothetical protein
MQSKTVDDEAAHALLGILSEELEEHKRHVRETSMFPMVVCMF